MESREADVVLITPTLSLSRAAQTLLEARTMAGMPCAVLMASDQEKRGAVVANNVLIRAALEWGAKYVVYVNDDCSGFPQGWLKRLIEAVDSKPEYGIAVAGAPCRTPPQCKGGPGLQPAIIEMPHPAAWVVAVIKASVFRAVGFLNTNLIHYADDSDFEMRMREKGLVSVYVQDVWVEHDTGPGHWVDEWYRHDRAWFRERWGR